MSVLDPFVFQPLVDMHESDFSSSLVFGESMSKQSIKVYATDFYKQDKFGTINVFRKWINEASTCNFRKSYFSRNNAVMILLSHEFIFSTLLVFVAYSLLMYTIV